MKSLGKKLLEAAKESDSALAKMIVDGNYKTGTDKERSETRKKPKFSKKHKRNRGQRRFHKPNPTSKPEVVEAKPES